MCVGVNTRGHHRVPRQREERVGADKAEETMVDHLELAAKTVKLLPNIWMTSDRFSTSYESKSRFFSREVRLSIFTSTSALWCVNRDKTEAARG